MLTIRDYAPSDWPRLCEIHDAARRRELALAGLEAAFLPLETAGGARGAFRLHRHRRLSRGQRAGGLRRPSRTANWPGSMWTRPSLAAASAARWRRRPCGAWTLRAWTWRCSAATPRPLRSTARWASGPVARESGHMPGNEGFAVTVDVLSRARDGQPDNL